MSEIRQAILYAAFLFMIQYEKNKKKKKEVGINMALHNISDSLILITPRLGII